MPPLLRRRKRHTPNRTSHKLAFQTRTQPLKINRHTRILGTRRTPTRLTSLCNNLHVLENNIPKIPGIVVQLDGEQGLVETFVDVELVGDALTAGGGGSYIPVAATSGVLERIVSSG